MALPNELKVEKAVAVKQALSKMSSEEIGALPPLDTDDFHMFGALSQTYCFIDLNLRRAAPKHAAAVRQGDVRTYGDGTSPQTHRSL